MAIDLGAGIMAKLTALFASIFSSQQAAQDFADDPNGVAEQYGLTSEDLSDGVNVTQAALQACQSPGVPAQAQQAVQNYASQPHPPAYTVQEVVQQVQQVTYVTYEDNDTIIDHLTQNNTNIEVGDDAHDVNIDVDNLTQGDNSVGNTGNDAHVAGATGDRANASTGDNTTQSSGDGSVTVGGGSTVGTANANSGTFTGQQGQSNSANDSVFGNNNQTANVDSANGDVFIPFGSGNTAVQHSDVHDANVGVGGNAQNISNNTASEGGAIGGHDAHGSFTDSHDTTTTTTTTTDDHSQVDNSIDESTHADHGSIAQGGFGNLNENLDSPTGDNNDDDDFDV
jgi:hypothetical protein